MAFKRLIKEQQLPYELTLAGSVKEARSVFDATTFDVVISDFLLGDGTSFEYLPDIIQTGIPVILVTGTGDEDLAVKAIKMGASDYLIKDVEFGHLKMIPIIVESSLQKKLSDSKIKKLTLAVEQSPSMLIITDAAGMIEYINPRVTEITGYELIDFAGTDLFNHHASYNSPEMVQQIISTVSNGNKWQETTCHRKKSGEIFWESTTISAIYDDDGHLSGYIKVAEDITEKRNTEEAIRKYSEELRESNASKDKMFSIIAHDLRTPFNGLLAFSEILNNDYHNLSAEEITEYISVISNLSRNTFNLLEKLLQWSRLQTGRMEFKPQPIALHEVVDNILSLLSANAKGKNISLHSNIDQGLLLNADPNMVNAVIRNLTSNAIKFTRENGIVQISAKANNAGMAEIIVSDNGIGIPAEHLQKLFRVDIHHSTTGTGGESGTGLGLLLCKEFIELHQGNIHVESEAGQGSKFIFTLPLA